MRGIFFCLTNASLKIVKNRENMLEKEKKEAKIERKTKKFMKSVEAFLKSKNGGEVAPEWACSLFMLEEYYTQFCQLSEEIGSLTSLVVDSRYGTVPHPLLAARDKTAIRLESLLKNLGLTFKESLKMDLIEPVVEESPLDKWVGGRIEKR